MLSNRLVALEITGASETQSADLTVAALVAAVAVRVIVAARPCVCRAPLMTAERSIIVRRLDAHTTNDSISCAL